MSKNFDLLYLRSRDILLIKAYTRVRNIIIDLLENAKKISEVATQLIKGTNESIRLITAD